MMRIKSIVLVAALLVLTTAQPQAKAVRNLLTPPAAPDLVVVGVTSPNLDGGQVDVVVKNQGDAAAASCYLALRMPGKVFSPKIPALAPGQETKLVVQTKMLLSQVAYQAIADRSNTVKESNESNNTLSSKFEGKP